MHRYTVINQPVVLHCGILELTPKQSASRTVLLADLGEGYYQILHPVQFKVGESIGYDGDINKDLAQSLDSHNSPISHESPDIKTKKARK